jgi:hypothetical protein
VTESIDREDQAILAALAALEAEAPDEALREGWSGAPGPWKAPNWTEGDETLRRLYVETLGLLGYAGEPGVPRAGARERLLAALGERVRKVEEPEEPGAEVVPLAARRTSAGDPSGDGDEQAAGEVPPRRRSWAGRLAALAAALLLGAALAAVWLSLELQGARDALTRLEAERTDLAERLSRQEALIRRGGQIGEMIAAVATPGVDVCPLHPMGDPPLVPGAYAVLYMPPGSGKWYLLASNLEPAEGVYMVWLDTPGGALPAGVLSAGTESVLELDPARP